MEISLLNVNFFYQRVNLILFLELYLYSTLFLELCLLYLKNNPFKIILTPKRHIWGDHILLLFRDNL